jgi:hypothetical protein
MWGLGRPTVLDHEIARKNVTIECFNRFRLDRQLEQLEVVASVDDGHLKDEIIEIAVPAGVIKADGAQGAVGVDVVAVADGGVRRPASSLARMGSDGAQQTSSPSDPTEAGT